MGPRKFLTCGQAHRSRTLIPKLPSGFLSIVISKHPLKMQPSVSLGNLDEDYSGLFMLSGIIGYGGCYSFRVSLSKRP